MKNSYSHIHSHIYQVTDEGFILLIVLVSTSSPLEPHHTQNDNRDRPEEIHHQMQKHSNYTNSSIKPI